MDSVFTDSDVPSKMQNVRVGIMTFHSAFNYGAMLQAYATQVAVNRCGYKSAFIDYYPKENERENKNLDIRIAYPKSILKCIYSLLNSKARVRRGRFDEFRNDMQRTRRFEKKTDISADTIACDMLLVGSDQVWNCEQGFDPFWFLDWLPISFPRCSYASSFGTSSVSEEMKQRINHSLAKFSHVSVREQDGVEILKGLGKNVTRVLDPTFLLDSQEWISVSREYSLDDRFLNGYILCHGFDNSPSTVEFVGKLKEYYKLPVVVLAVGISSPLKGDLVIIDAGPREYIDLYRKATVAYTNSFHGVAFAIHFRKPFFVVPHKTRNSRVENLLALFGLGDRMVSDAKVTNVGCAIEYSKIEERIKCEVLASKEYLKVALQSFSQKRRMEVL